MPLRKDHTAWRPAEERFCSSLAALGIGNASSAKRQNAKFHKGKPVRSAAAVSIWRTKHGIRIAKRPKGAPEAVPSDVALEQRVERTETADGITLLATGQRIKTVDDVIRYADIDLTKFEIAKQEASTWDTTVRDQAGKVQRVQNFRIWVQVKPKAGPSTLEAVEALIAGVTAKRKVVFIRAPRVSKGDKMQAMVFADPHIGKLAWPAETGREPWDTENAVDTVRAGATDLLAEGDRRGIAERRFVLLGDIFHHDGKGMTTSGTVMDYDSRVQKMLRAGSELLFDLIAQSAKTVLTKVYVVPGNHDRVLSWALQLLLQTEFKRHGGVVIDETYTTTKFMTWGRCLIGMDHGDKGKTRLPAHMASQCEVEWGNSICREILTGHLHSKASIQTVNGITVRTMDALCPTDLYHAEEKFTSSVRTMEAITYHKGGMPAHTDVWSPDLHRPARRGAA